MSQEHDSEETFALFIMNEKVVISLLRLLDDLFFADAEVFYMARLSVLVKLLMRNFRIANATWIYLLPVQFK